MRKIHPNRPERFIDKSKSIKSKHLLRESFWVRNLILSREELIKGPKMLVKSQFDVCYLFQYVNKVDLFF